MMLSWVSALDYNDIHAGQTSTVGQTSGASLATTHHGQIIVLTFFATQATRTNPRGVPKFTERFVNPMPRRRLTMNN